VTKFANAETTSALEAFQLIGPITIVPKVSEKAPLAGTAENVTSCGLVCPDHSCKSVPTY
jgi:hypothetical protein